MDSGLKYWLALSRARGLERGAFKGLIEAFGGAEGLLGKGPRPLRSISAPLHEWFKGFEADDGWSWVERELKLVEGRGARIIAFTDPDYPPLLREIDDPPCLLYARGGWRGRLERPSVAVVGTRRPTHYGASMAESLSRELSAFGATVVSGMARGCDTLAHRGALAGGGFTVAVLGTGVDVVYPPEGVKLYEEIAEKGMVVSELPMGRAPLPGNFPRRNRIISGLSLGVLVVEAPLRSGSLMTARLALEYNREVFAVPGEATSAKSVGTNRLIRDGAFLAASARDVMEGLGLSCAPLEDAPAEGAKGADLGDEERLVWSSLSAGPLNMDGIIDKTGIPAMRASALLLDMELKGLIEQRPGKCFLRRF
jgi:DNA processing protein